MKQNIISLIIIAFGAICVAQLTIQITNQCECSQFSQKSCGSTYGDQSCQWNSASQTCERKGCSQFNTSNSCLQNFVECYWNGNKCLQFSSCSQLSYQNLSCIQQNIQCGSFPSNSTNCQQLNELPLCSYFNQDQCTPQQLGYQGSQCIWNDDSSICQTALCSSITQFDQCNQFQNLCSWNQTFSECVQLQCSSFKNASTCTYIYGSYNLQNIIPCIFINGQCQEVYFPQQLNASDCSSKTLSTYYWIQTQNNTGMCVSCMYQFNPNSVLSQYQPNNKCQCSNYLQQQCQSSSYCSWSETNNECTPQVCSQINQQLSCIQNLECSWSTSTNTCSTFQNCPIGVDQEQCIQSSFNCLLYNYGQCSPLSNNTCSYIYNIYQCNSQLGYCYWSGNSCMQVEKCSQIAQPRQCYRFGYSCTWQNGKCESLKCSMIGFENSCIYTIPTLYTNDVQPCIWQNGKCQNLYNINNLNSTQCTQKSLDTFKWTGSKCVSCSQSNQQIYKSLHLPHQCQCFQLFTSQLCSSNSNCEWNGSQCIQKQCQNITNQLTCASNPNCAWVDDQCQQFKLCQLLQGTSQSDCIVQSINCPASNGINCLNQQSLQGCSSYAQQNSCQNQFGNDGYCFWQNQSCQVLSKCQQITTSKDCLFFSKQCYWDDTNCLPISCSIFTSISTCQFYFTSINSLIAVPCYWNSTKGVCTQATDYMTQLNQENCQTNTNYNARWSQTLNACLSCQIYLPPNPKQCTCAQLISSFDCIQNQQCIWNSQINTCLQLPCQNLSQQLCIQNLQCMWTGSCQQFTSCSNLNASTSEECAAQSLYCPYYNSSSKKCQALAKSEFQGCEGQKKSTCTNVQMPPYFFCYWNISLNKCQSQDYCEQYSNNQYMCQNNYYCYYDNNTCKPKLCQNLYTKEQCVFVINPKNINYVQSCAWINGACQPADNSFSQSTCYSNTDQTARWSSNFKDGFCIPCNLPLQQALVPSNQCLCTQLLTQYECELSSCQWEREGYCNQKSCLQLSQFDCIQNIQCFWIYSNTQSQGGQCLNIKNYVQDYKKDPCTKLKGNTALECLSQSLLCPVSLNGVCQNRALLQTCQSMKSLQLCANSIGQEGYCTYENQQCQVLSNCSQLKKLSDCSIFSNSCQFNSTSGTCEQLFCSSYKTQQDCTYIFQNINKANIQQCAWNSQSNTCSTATYLIQQTYENCYTKTGGTFHWSNPIPTSGQCVSCALRMIKPKNTCSCTLLNQMECTLSNPICKLNQNNQCVKAQCNEILDSVHCSQEEECMWKQNQCVKFTKCTDLNGNNQLDCAAQSLQCQSVNNGVCQPTSSLNSCKSYSSNTTCTLGKWASDGFCYYNYTNKVCQVISSCSDVDNQQLCLSLKPACQWSYFFSSCVPFQCQDYLDQDTCTNVIVNLQDPQIELCVWQNQKCVPFVDTYYRFDDAICYINSDHTYRWIKEDKFGVRCQQCLQAFLINIIAIILLNCI